MIITQRPEDILTIHADLARLHRNPHPIVQKFLQSFMTQAHSRRGGSETMSMFYPVLPPDYRGVTLDQAAELARSIGADLTDAVTYEITKDMGDVMKAVYDKSVRENDRLNLAELPCESGFAWFDDGWSLTDATRTAFTIRGLSWRAVTAVTARTVPPDSPYAGQSFAPANEVIDWPCVRVNLWVHTDDDPPDAGTRGSPAGEIQIMHTAVVPFDIDITVPASERANGAESFLNVLHLLWQFLQMEIIGTRTPKIQNWYRRHALKSLVHGEVHVVLLRRVRYATETEEHHEVDWSCQWVVSGHYRHAEAPSPPHRAVASPHRDEDGNTLCFTCGMALHWVRPYIKGPDGLPLKVSKTLMKLARLGERMPMSVDPIWSVHCDGCLVWTAQEETAASAVKTARARGWYIGRTGRGPRMCYCPTCRIRRDL